MQNAINQVKLVHTLLQKGNNIYIQRGLVFEYVLI